MQVSKEVLLLLNFFLKPQTSIYNGFMKSEHQSRCLEAMDIVLWNMTQPTLNLIKVAYATLEKEKEKKKKKKQLCFYFIYSTTHTHAKGKTCGILMPHKASRNNPQEKLVAAKKMNNYFPSTFV